MKSYPFLRTVALSACILLTSSCSKDDDHGDPAGTITVNLLNEANGRTLLGNSDVYIDKADNFYGPSCLISSLGSKKGLGSISTPQLDGLSSKAAVEPGYAYQVFKERAIREFPSGKQAINITADYYNVYVLSPIKQGEVEVGAKVQFVLMPVPKYDLPAYDSKIEYMEYEYLIDKELAIDLPTSDFEYELDPGANQIGVEKRGKQLVLWLERRIESDNFGVYIRIRESFTYMQGRVR